MLGQTNRFCQKPPLGQAFREHSRQSHKKSVPVLETLTLRALTLRASTLRALTLAFVGAAAFISLPAETLAQGEANFEERSLQPGFSDEQGMLNGRTGGSYSLAAISNRDVEGVACLGYGDSRPDHILTLQADFTQLAFQIESRGQDTALLIQGPGGVRCGEDASSTNLDDRIELKDLKRGQYSIWVGTMMPGNRQGYRLMVSEE